MISFNRPLFLLCTLLIPLYFILRRLSILRPIEFPLTLGDWNGMPFKWSSPIMTASLLFSRFAAVAAFLCIIVAASGPVRFRQEHVFTGSGSAIIFALDISPSMAARDMGTETRLETARRIVNSFIDKRQGDSFGLVGLGSDAALLVPSTTDHALLKTRLDSLVIGELGEGTAIGLGLAVAAAHLMNRENKESCVILLTDGENNTGEIHPKTAAAVYAENNIRLYIVGIGTKGDVSIEYTDPSTGKQYSGVLNSEYSESFLRSIAERGKGTYLQAGSRETLASVFTDIGEAIPGNSSSFTRTIEESLERPCIFLALAFAAFVWILKRLVMGAVL